MRWFVTLLVPISLTFVNRRARSFYSLEEDLTLLDHVRRSSSGPGSRATYETLARARILDRTPESMRNRYKKLSKLSSTEEAALRQVLFIGLFL